MAKYFRVRNYEKWQGDNRRKTDSWVKLHKDVLLDREFLALDDAERAHYMLILVLARPKANVLPYDPKYIAECIHARKGVDLRRLLKLRLIEACNKEGHPLKRAHDARTMRANGKPNASILQASRAGEEESRGEESRGDKMGLVASDEFFEQAWSFYPKRAGGNPKPKAERAWRARLKSGTDPQAMLTGTVRYLEYCRAVGREGTEYVMQAARFYGPDREFEAEWEIPDEHKVPEMYLEDGIQYNPEWLAWMERESKKHQRAS